jgi:hypothetical protein
MFSLYKTCTTKYDEILGQRKKKSCTTGKSQTKQSLLPLAHFLKIIIIITNEMEI